MKTFSPSVAKPPLKRRKLVRNSGSTLTSISSPPSAKTQGTTVIANASKGIPICATCHRALQSTTAGSIIQCAICLSTTCAVCSRTCTHSAASQPPTPHLTWSPTPSPSPMPSPRRSVLSLNSSNVNLPLSDLPQTPTQSSATGKRRKHTDEDDIPSYPDVKSTSHAEDQGEFGEGCGRFVCRNCCYEDTHNNTTTCLDCYGSRT
ncbi:hypothetical protein BDN70DRAFT_874426 [Pholiota conissans]|uniref:Uncharacterized protein n=1 Tax=Pholiota conissans TaxID=109636 RepID=A0A9P6D482_9AGAR|nr:hypothetical protein BDN70DRAFT_874426 [Pholiota conissans]